MPVKGKFFGVGLGPGDPDLITRKGWEALCHADIIYTVASRQGSSSQSRRIVTAQPGVRAEQRELVFAMNQDWDDRMATIARHAADIAAELKNGNSCAFATIGDVLTYSTCGYLLDALLQLIPELETTIIPGVNSWSALTAANSGLPLVSDQEKLTVIPGYITPDRETVAGIIDGSETVVFLKTYRSRNEIINLLRDFPVDILYGANVGMDNQFISTDINEITARKAEYLSMLIVRKRQSGAD